MSKRFILFLALGTIAILGIFGGCSQTDKQVARIGAKNGVTVGELEEKINVYIQNKYKRERPDSIPKSVFTKELESLVHDRLILSAAYQAGLDQDSSIIEKVTKARRSNAMNELYNREVIDKVVPEKDIRRFWARTGIEAECRKIEFHTSGKDSIQQTEIYETVEDVLKRVREGESFSRLARQYSDERTSARKGGEMTPFWYTLSGDPLVEAAFSAKAGDIVGPIKISKGWAILSVDEMVVKNKEPYAFAYEGMRKYISEQRGTERNTIANAYIESLREKYNVVIHDAAVDTLAFFFKTWRSSKGQVDFADSLKALPEPILAMPMLTSDLEDISLGDATVILSQNQRALRQARLTNPKVIKDFLNSQIQAKMFDEDTQKKRLLTHPTVEKKTLAAQNQEMISLYISDVINMEVEADSLTKRAFYEKQKESRYKVKAKATVQEIQVTSRREANRLLDRLKAGEDFGRLAEEATIRAGYKKRQGKLPVISEGSWGEIGVQAFKMKEGGLALVPLKDSKFSILKLLKLEPAQILPFETVAQKVEASVLVDLRKEHQEAWLQAQKEKQGVFIDEVVLNNVWKSYQKQSITS